MKTPFAALPAILLLFAASCTGADGLRADGERGLDHSSHARVPEGKENPETPEGPGTTVYLSGVRYPDGYDWRHSTDEAEHIVFLLGDGEPLFESSLAPAEADTRLISGGHLFHTVTEGDSTFVFCDGKRRIAYRAREMTAALEDDGNGNILSIGEPRSTEEAFTYRINGSAKMKRNGLLVSETIKNAVFHYRDTDGDYIIVENGIEKQTVAPVADGTIVKAIVLGAKTYAYEKIGPYILIQSEGKGVYLIVPSYYYSDFRLEDWFFYDGDGFLTFVSATDFNGIPKAVIFRNGKQAEYFEGYEFYNVLCEGSSLALVLKVKDREEYAISVNMKSPDPLPENFIPHSKRAMDFSGGTLRLALDTPQRPVLWQDGAMSRFSFNGYIDNIVVQYSGE